MTSTIQKALRKPSSLLRQGGRIAVLAPSSPSDIDQINLAVGNLRDRGLEVTISDNIAARHMGYLAGEDSIRLQRLNDALRAAHFDGFLFSRGGYGAMRILDGLDYDAIAANPRPMIGYSDVTALHQAVAVRAGVGTFHGPMLNADFHDGLSPDIEQWFWDVLAGEVTSWAIEPHQVMSHGSAEGILFGGCLSLTTALTGTPYDYWIDDGIWFWEDVAEPTYRVDRMLTHLKLSGKLRKIKGVMIGRLKDCGGGYPDELDRLLASFFADAGIPVLRELPFGHHADNLLLPIGTPVRIDTRSATFSLLEPAVTTQRDL
ncbi:MAG TPA: LD-carboxypeptidase [Thermoanaerobaculia bacterium]|nr:LD-carboxypeptidase [Thermoanaerobaculia bacterium]